MQKTRVRRSREEWFGLVQQWEASGKNASQWCRETEIPYESFILWRKRLKGAVSQIRSSFVELSEGSVPNSGIEIHFRNLTLSLCKNFDSVALCRCLQVLEKL
jgi:hypothetical protein